MGNCGIKMAGVLLLTLVCSGIACQAQLLPPDPFQELDSWSFDDTNFLSDLGDAPISMANLENPPSFDGNAVQVDSTNAAWLQYRIANSTITNLTFPEGTIELWASVDWNSGSGPGNFGRLIDVGAYSTNTSSSWWSLYFTPDGSRLNFSSETNGVFTNYLSVPIAWSSNAWHFLALTYNHYRSQLYVDGQLATNGAPSFYLPSPSVASNGFFLGSDATGTAQARACLDDLATFGYALTAYDVTNDYAAGLALMGGGFHPDSGPGFPGGGVGSGGTPAVITNNPINYGTNLWIARANISTNALTAIGSNTLSDVTYEIQSLNSLTQTNWVSQGFFLGSETTNFTPLNALPVSLTNNFFIRLRSWVDSDAIGIPDWWQLQYFGYVGIDPNALDAAGDGYTIYQKFKLGLAPNVFYTPAAPQGVTTTYSTNGTATISWLPSPGNVTGYTVTDSEGNTFTFSTDTTSFVDTNVDGTPYDFADDGPTIGTTISLQANYGTNGSSAVASGLPLEPNSLVAEIVPGPQGAAYLLVSAWPANTAIISLTLDDYTAQQEDEYGADYPVAYTNFDIPIARFTNGVCVLPNPMTPPDANGYSQYYWFAQAIGTNGSGLSAATSISGNYTSPQDVFQNSWLVMPFFDGRVQLKQNLIFQMRAAVLDRPFQYTENYAGPDFSDAFFTAPTNYVYAGYYNFDNFGGAVGPNIWFRFLDVFLPFEENNFDRNFALDSAYLDANGRTTTGVGGAYDDYGGGGLTVDSTGEYVQTPFEGPFAYEFVAPTTNGVAIPAVLAANQTRWLATYPLDSGRSSLLEIGVTNEYSYDPPVNAMYGSVSNWFGLHYLSAAIGSAGPTTNLLYAGAAMTNDGYFYPETAQPQLGITGYLYWLPSSGSPECNNGTDFPGMAGLSATHTNSLLITSVGNASFQLACYAKLAVTNAYPGVYGYLGQYFDQAYQIDTNGVATTNPTGILSPYGAFFATQPGPAALVTMPDIDTGERGTCTVYAVSMQLDKHHDTNMANLSFNSPDATTPASPMQFWVNNNYDRWATTKSLYGLVYTDVEQDDQKIAGCPYTPYTPTPDYDYRNAYGNRVIPCTRDLEDFTRLWVCGVTSNLLAALPYGSSVTLTWGSVSAGTPTIDLFQAADPDGGIGYLTNETTAAAQTNIALCPYVGRLAPGDSIQLNSLENTLATSHFIWCGVSNGTGGLTLTIKDANNNILVQTTAYIQLQDIKQMYERWTVGDNPLVAPASTASLATENLPVGAPAFRFSPPSDTNTAYILHVHGYNMESWAKDRFAETEYKRLYWQGYQGRFGEFRWPTTVQGIGNLFSAFDLSESNSWSSAPALLNLLTNLDAEYAGNVYLTAHSHGNVAAGEALRLAGSHQVVNTYIALQAAVAAHAYDPATPDRYTPVYPDDYAQYWPNGGSCYFNGSQGAGTYVNFLNTNDWALTLPWPHNQLLKPVSGYTYGIVDGQTNFYSGTDPYFTLLAFPADRYTIFSYCDPAPCVALGAQPNVDGPFTGKQLNLPTVWPPDPSGENYQAHLWHSAEFRSDTPQRWLFWNAVLTEMKLK